MPHVIRVLEVAGAQTMPGDPAGMYVVDCDVDAHDGRGDAELTDDWVRAKRFANIEEALTFYRRESTVKPLREDGQPNRPLTAYTVEVIRVP